jgi:hypothetical protein
MCGKMSIFEFKSIQIGAKTFLKHFFLAMASRAAASGSGAVWRRRGNSRLGILNGSKPLANLIKPTFLSEKTKILIMKFAKKYRLSGRRGIWTIAEYKKVTLKNHATSNVIVC